MGRAIVENVLSGTKAGLKATRNFVFNQKAERNTMNRQKSRAIVENVLSGTKAGLKATRNFVFNQKAERSTMNRQKSRGIVDNVLSGTKACFKTALTIIFNNLNRRKIMPINKNKISKMQSLLLTLTLMVAAFWVSPAAAQQYVTDPATGKTWTAPQYGGTLTWAHKQFPKSTDPYSVGGWGPHFISAVNEKLAFGDWAVDREKVVDLAWTYTGPEMYRGCLAESWEMPDATTFIFHIRQGVYWHDKAPMNGRQFDADDVVYNWHRYLGQGDFTEEGPSPLGYITQGLEESSVTATDKWTVEFKLAKPKPDMEFAMTHNANHISPRGNREIRRLCGLAKRGRHRALSTD